MSEKLGMNISFKNIYYTVAGKEGGFRVKVLSEDLKKMIRCIRNRFC